ncbi:MAG: single-stranded-DNA-specific exonuclease RecJ [Candidatus Doudnabacteria bacterium]|nr:single-stranded-DNA-specific exonuclease RecJ [Candidatus Doudnabacteria bacterium]
MAADWKTKPEMPEGIFGVVNDLPRLLLQLLFNRGLSGEEEARKFIDCKYEGLHDPFLFRDMRRAADRIWEAVEAGEKICIYGDYDADAVTANAVLRQTFGFLGVTATSYIPDRFTEGYGVNLEALMKIKDEGTKVIITVDCGTNSADAAEFCAANNIDFIITDHHELIGDAPKAYALINPKNPEDTYPYSEITGVGVAFKLACGILSYYDRVTARLWSGTLSTPTMPAKKYAGGFEKWLLDLVAIGTVADCHSLMGENRILVKYGLKVLEKTRWPGLKAIILSAGLDFKRRPADTYSLGFVIAPRLNAAGRLEHANVALDVLLETDANLAAEKAQKLDLINRRRQDLTERVLSEARERAILLKDRKILALMGEGWAKGVVGLVAGRLAEEFNKPAIILEKLETLSTGSARTAGEFNILEAIKFASAHLEKFGGHKQAAGLSLKPEKFEVFYQQVLIYADANMPREQAPRVLEMEAELLPEDLQLTTYSLVAMMEPFGVDNPKPKFLIKGAQIISARVVGQIGKHLQFRLKAGNKEIAAIYFNAPEFAKHLKIGDTVNVAAELIEDGWNGRREVKLRIVDLKNK